MKHKGKYGCCATCQKEMKGNMYCLSVGAFYLNHKDTSVKLPKNRKIEPWFNISSHPCKDGKHVEDANMWGSVDLFEAQDYVYDNQAESYFCSKQCIVDWFAKQIRKKLPEINI